MARPFDLQHVQSHPTLAKMVWEFTKGSISVIQKLTARYTELNTELGLVEIQSVIGGRAAAVIADLGHLDACHSAYELF